VPAASHPRGGDQAVSAMHWFVSSSKRARPRRARHPRHRLLHCGYEAMKLARPATADRRRNAG